MSVAAGAHSSHTVLVVDDDARVLETLQDLLERDGVTVVTAQTAEEALKILEGSLPCMVLVDVMMPGVSGFDVCRRLKLDPRTADLPVALVTARANEADVQEGIGAGAVDYIKKPFDREEVRMRVRTQIRLHEALVEQQRLNKHLTVISGAARDAIIVIDSDGTIAHWNAAAEAMFGHPRAKVLGKDLHALLAPPRLHEAQACAFPRFQATGEGEAVGKTLELVGVRKSGEEFPLELSLTSTRVDGAWCAVGIVRDITERRREAAALRRSDRQFQAMFEQATVGFAMVDVDGKWLRVNRRLCEILGYPAEELLQLRFQDITHPEDLAADLEALRAMRDGELTNVEGQKRYVRKDGREVWTNRSVGAVTDEAGQLDYHLVVIEDITEKKRTEQAVRESEEWHRVLFENSRDCLMTLEPPSWAFTSGNSATLAMFRAKDQADFLSRGPRELSPERQRDGRPSAEKAREMGERAMREGSHYFEWTHRRLDGTEFPATVLLTRVELRGKRFLQATVRDVTESKRMEEALHQSERLSRATVDALSAHLAILDETGRILTVNDAWRRFAVANPPVLGNVNEGANYLAVCDSATGPSCEGAAEFAAGIRSVLNGTRVDFTMEYPCHSANESRWFVGRVTRFPGQGATRVAIAHENITERKRAEDATKQSSSLLNTILDAVPVPLFYKDTEGRFLGVNRHYAEFYGATSQAIVGKTVFDFSPRETAEGYHQHDLALLKHPGVQVYETHGVDGQGAIHDIVLHKATFCDAAGTVRGLVGAFLDITDRKRAEAATREASAFLTTILNALPVAVFYKDAQGRYLGVNKAFEEFYGQTREAFVGKTVFDQFPQATAEAFHRMDVELLQNPGVQVSERRSADSQGVLHDTLVHKATFTDSAGRVRGFVGAFLDITDRKRAEEASKEASAFLTTILNAIPVPVFYKDPEGHYLGVNKAFGELTGHSPEDIFGKTVFEIFPRETAEAYHAKDLELLQHRGVQVWDGQMKDDRKTIRDVVFHKATFTNPDGRLRGIIGAILDVTERKQIEAKLAQSRKLEAVGQLAAGIAHEINTPTQFVGDSVHFLKEAFEGQRQVLAQYRRAAQTLGALGGHEAVLDEIRRTEEEADLGYLEENVPGSFDRCLDGLSRIATIVRAMKEFAQPEQTGKAPADLNQALQNTLIIARNEYKYVAEVETELGELPLVLCHLGDLNQVFLNLIVNAAQAIGEVVGQFGTKGQIRIKSLREGDSVRIDISDTGAGIPPSIRDRIFEPFFTTKEVGKGSGQGLTIARSIVVDKHAGWLTFESEVGKGTTFTIRLPILERSAPGANEVSR